MGADLKSLQIPFTAEERKDQTDTRRPACAAISIKFSKLLKPRKNGRAPNPSKLWAADIVRLEHRGFNRKDGQAVHVLKGILKRPEELRQVMTAAQDQDAVFDKRGVFAVTVKSPFGQSCIQQLVSRLTAIDRILSMVDTIKKENLECKSVSLAGVTVGYGKGLSTEISFAEDNQPMTAEFSPANPHRRIKVLLSNILNRDGFHNFVNVIKFTLPVLSAIQTIEAAELQDITLPIINTRSVDCFCIDYRSLSINLVLELRLRRHRDQLEWHIDDYTRKRARELKQQTVAGREPAFTEALEKLFMSNGKGWSGLRTLVVASIDGAEEAILKMNETIMPFAKKDVGKPQPADKGGREVIMVD